MQQRSKLGRQERREGSTCIERPLTSATKPFSEFQYDKHKWHKQRDNRQILAVHFWEAAARGIYYCTKEVICTDLWGKGIEHGNFDPCPFKSYMTQLVSSIPLEEWNFHFALNM